MKEVRVQEEETAHQHMGYVLGSRQAVSQGCDVSEDVDK